MRTFAHPGALPGRVYKVPVSERMPLAQGLSITVACSIAMWLMIIASLRAI
jgi:hypothetical protein